MVQGYFYNSVNGDRKYNADSVNESKRPFYRDGVFDGQLEVTADGNGMAVTVDGGEHTGYAWINAHTIHNTTPLTLDVSQASGTLDRIDRVVLRNDETERKPSVYILEGSFSSNPKAPELTNTEAIQEKCLAEIYVHAGAVAITQADITDTREDETVCGFVVSQISSSSGSEIHPIYFSDGKPKACTYTLEKSVPANAVFTDTNTWRGIQNNLTSDSTTDSLSAAQGKVLKGLVDGKAASNHTHSYLPLSGGTVTGGANFTGYPGISFIVNDPGGSGTLRNVNLRRIGGKSPYTFGFTIDTYIGGEVRYALQFDSYGAVYANSGLYSNYNTNSTANLRNHVLTTVPEANKPGRACRYVNTNSANSGNVYYLTVNGGWNSTTTGNVTTASHNIVSASSDIRLKENIKDTEIEAISTIMKIRMRQFDWKDKNIHQELGFIADELEAIDSHFAFGGGYEEDGSMNIKSVDTFYLMGYLVKAIQELAAWKAGTEERIEAILLQNAERNSEIAGLKKENEELKEQIRDMKTQMELILQNQQGKEDEK